MDNPPADLGRSRLPRHVAVIMDGNGRWARARGKPRTAGHRAGVRSARRIVRACHRRGIEVLTLFAFSQENWQRPPEEVSTLMGLFLHVLERQLREMHDNGIRLRFIGDHSRFAAPLRQAMRDAERLTAANRRMTLVVALGYGGQWDISQAAAALAAAGEPITQESLAARLSTTGLPDPDLMIRTGGEQRISNFMLWQLAYAELYFCEVLWPDFREEHLAAALDWYATRERRFGRVPEGA